MCVVGTHFALAVDRQLTDPDTYPRFPSAEAGGCANLVDDALKRGDKSAMVQMVSLEGSYGQVWRVTKGTVWRIEHSTIPWREGAFLRPGGFVRGSFRESGHGAPTAVLVDDQRWEIEECTFPAMVLESMFTPSDSKL